MIAAASSKKRTPREKNQYPHSLVRNVVLWLLALSLLPVLAVGIVTYIRTRTILTQQANGQLQAVVENYTVDLEKYAAVRKSALEDMVRRSDFGTWIILMTQPDITPEKLTLPRSTIEGFMQSSLGVKTEPVFDEIFLLDEGGKVLAATNAKRYDQSLADSSEIRQMMGTNKSAGVYNVPGLFPGDFTWMTSYTYTLPANGQQFTFIGAVDAPIVKTVLNQGSKYLTNSRAFLFTNADYVIGLSMTGELLSFQNSGEQMTALHSVAGAERMRATQKYTSYGKLVVMSYARWLPDLNMGMAVEVPENVIYAQIRSLAPFYLLILVFCVIVAAISLIFGTSSIVTPILGLVEHVRAFAQGNFESRAPETRKDELGLLAHSFNQMADQLGQMYRQLESKVEERNRQLTTAAEVAQVTTSTTSREEILQKTVALVTDRFEYDFACIYLLDPTGSSFTASEAGGRLSEGYTGLGLNQRIRTQSIFGIVIAHNSISVLEEPRHEGVERPETLLPGARSEAIVPISAGNQVLGILDVQSGLGEVFTTDTLNVLKMLATQVANGLQNIQLLESTRIDLQETNLLYRASRQITQAAERGQIGKVISETVAQTPYLGLILTAEEGQLRATSVIDGSDPARRLDALIVPLQKVTDHLGEKPYLLVDNLNQAGDLYPILHYYDQNGCVQVALLQIKVGGKISKIIVLGSRKRDLLTDTTIQPYLSLAEVIANTEERFYVLQTLENNLAEMKTVSTISQALSVETDLQVLFHLLHEQIVNNLGGPVDFYVALNNEATGMIELPFVVENGVVSMGEPFPYGDGITSVLIQSGKPLLFTRNAVQQAAAMGVKLVGLPARSWVGVPLTLGSKVVGVMAAEDAQTDGRFSERELSLFTSLAPQVAVAIRNAQLLTQMQAALTAYDQERFLLNTLLDKIPDQIYFKDPEGRYIRGSQSLLTLLGIHSQTELVGRTEDQLTGSQDAAVREEEQAVVATGQAHEGIIEKYVREDGSEEWALVSRLPMVDENSAVIGLLGISRDITGLKQAEELAQKRAQQLRTAAEIARDTSGSRNLDELLPRAVNLIRERFGFYHASIFLLDTLGEYAVLRESTGEAGARLKEAGHRLAVGSQSIVGQTISRGEALVVNDVTLDPNYYPNPLLPDTRSELSIPLKVGDRVLGVIDVQSTAANAFLSEDINILQVLADQLAIAIVNADLFVISQENLAKHRFLHQITTAAASATSLDEALESTVNGLITALGNERVAIYLSNPDGSLTVRAFSGYQDTDPLEKIPAGEGVIGLAALGRHPILIRDTHNDSRYTGADERVRSQIAVPILYSDRTVGVLSIESSRVAAFDENDQEILGSLGNNLGAILANTQLVTQVRQQVEQQKDLFDITSKIRRSTDVETVLQTSVREICRAVHARRARIQITIGGTAAPVEPVLPVPEATGENGRGGHNGYHGSNGHEGSQEAA